MPIKSPIIDAIVELRFKEQLPTQVAVGLIYQHFQELFTKVEDQPLLQIPPEIRKQNPDLKKQPHYKLIGEDYIVTLGEGLVGISVVVDRNQKYYPGWATFGDFAFQVIDFLNKSGIAASYNKIDVRYINYFESHGLDDKTNLEVKVAGKKASKNLTVFYEVEEEDYNTRVQLAANATVVSPYLKLEGTIVDINSGYSGDLKTLKDTKKHINALHALAEDTFFSVINRDILPPEVKPMSKEK